MTFEPGNYTGKFLSACCTKSKNGIPAIESQWDVDGKTVTVRTYLSDAAWEISEKKLRAAGFDGNMSKPGFPAEVELYLKYEVYKDADVERWDFSGGTGTPADDATVKTLQKRWKGSTPIKPPPAAGKPKPPGKPGPAPAAPVADEMSAWEAYSTAHPNATPDEWWAFIQATVGYTDPMTPADWAKVQFAAAGDAIPF